MKSNLSERRARRAKRLARWVVLAGVLNVVARTPVGAGEISVYYATAPFIAVALFLASSGFRYRLIFFVAAMAWGWVAGYLFGTSPSAMAAQTVFMFLCFIAIEAIVNWSVKSPTFYRDSERLFDVVTIFVVLVFVIQTILDFDVPGTAGYRRYGMSTSIFFTPNDLALYLSAYLILAVFSGKHFVIRTAIFAVVVGINTYNGSNLALAANMATGLVAFLMWPVRRVTYPIILVMLPALVAAPVAGWYILQSSASSGGSGGVLLALQKILTLERFNLAGSIYDRADALIIGVTEFANSAFFGFGPGGSTQLLARDENVLVSAKTMHNGLAELAFDLGPAFILPFVLGVSLTLLYLLTRRKPSKEEFALFALILCLPPMSMVQSGGFISNYGFWTCATAIWARAYGRGQNEKVGSAQAAGAA